MTLEALELEDLAIPKLTISFYLHHVPFFRNESSPIWQPPKVG
jgi:hypothetical protein